MGGGGSMVTSQTEPRIDFFQKENLGISNCDGNWYSVALHIITTLLTLGTLRNYDGEGNGNVKKQQV